MCAHDAVAQKDFYPHLPDIPIEIDEDEETIKIVQLVKSNEPLVSINSLFLTRPLVWLTTHTTSFIFDSLRPVELVFSR